LLVECCIEVAKIHQDTPWKDGEMTSNTSCLLYLDTLEDGDTVFYESATSKNGFMSSPSERGKIVFFDHAIWHSSNPSKDKKRVLLLKLYRI